MVRADGARAPSVRRVAPVRRSGPDSSALTEAPHTSGMLSARWKVGSVPAARPVVTDSSRQFSTSQKRAVRPRLPEGASHQVADNGMSRPGWTRSASARPSRAGSGAALVVSSARVRDQAAARALSAADSSIASSRRATACTAAAVEVRSRARRGISSSRAAWARRSSSSALRGPA